MDQDDFGAEAPQATTGRLPLFVDILLAYECSAVVPRGGRAIDPCTDRYRELRRITKVHQRDFAVKLYDGYGGGFDAATGELTYCRPPMLNELDHRPLGRLPAQEGLLDDFMMQEGFFGAISAQTERSPAARVDFQLRVWAGALCRGSIYEIADQARRHEPDQVRGWVAERIRTFDFLGVRPTICCTTVASWRVGPAGSPAAPWL